MGIHYQQDSIQTYRTSIEADRSDVWMIQRNVTVLSETGFAIHADRLHYNVTVHNEGELASWQDYGVRLDGRSNWVLNFEGATISGLGGVKAGAGSNVDNFGRIVTYSETRPAIDIDGRDGSGPARIDNSGMIEGATAIRAKGGAGLHLANDGTITGLITLGNGDDRIANHGLLDGAVALGGGRDVFIGTGGGAVEVDGGAGRDLIVGSDGADHLVGGRGRDKVHGGDGDDILVGCYGKDVLDGGEGADTFVFLRSGKANADRIKDFAVGEDLIQLDNAHFRKLGPEGALAAGAFQVGAHADEADHRVIYDARTGVLKYDANGDAAGGVKVIAKLAPGLELSHAHFEIV